MKKIIFAMALLCVMFTGCKKEDISQDQNNVVKEDLSYLITKYSREERDYPTSTCRESYYKYNGYKRMSSELYVNGQLSSKIEDFNYEGLNCSYDSYVYTVHTVGDSSYTGDLFLHQHLEAEYLDKTYLRIKHSINDYDYSDDSNNEDKVVEISREYDGKKPVGYKRIVNGVLEIENTDYRYDGLECSYTSRGYSNTGELVYVREYEIQYLDDTYLREKVTKYTTEYLDGSPTEVSYKSVQYEGKKPIGYKYFQNGILTEEGKNYVYNGLKCNYEVDRYFSDGTPFNTSSFEVHYLE